MKIMKFGGTSVGKPERMYQVRDLITRDAEPKIVVLSALSGTTNALVSIGDAMSSGDKNKAKELINQLHAHYMNFIEQLLKTDNARNKATTIINEHFEFLNIILKISFNDALNKDILAQGELMSTKMFSVYLEEIGEDHVLLPALDFMSIDANDEPQVLQIRAKLQKSLEAHPGKKTFYYTGIYLQKCKGRSGQSQAWRK